MNDGTSPAALQIADYGYVLETGAIALEGRSAELAGNPRVVESCLGVGRVPEPPRSGSSP